MLKLSKRNHDEKSIEYSISSIINDNIDNNSDIIHGTMRDARFKILQKVSGLIAKRQEEEEDKRNVISVSLIDRECVLIVLLSKFLKVP